jgi:hypothetical protein
MADPSPDPMMQRIVDHLMAAQVGLMYAADNDPSNVPLLEAQSFLWHALCTLTRITPTENEPSCLNPTPRVIAMPGARLI